MVIWITGISCSGKTTLCTALYKLLKSSIPQLVLLDGDVIRSAFANELGYREDDRKVQVKRVQNMAKLLSDQELIVLVAVLYSNAELLAWNRHNIDDYYEIYLEVSLDTVRKRDNKGIYLKAEKGDISDVVGIDILWNVPESPDLVINNDCPETPELMARKVIEGIPRLQLVRNKEN